MSIRGTLRIITPSHISGHRSDWYYISSDAGETAERTLQSLVEWANRQSELPSLGAMERKLKSYKHGRIFVRQEGFEHPFASDPEGRNSPFNEYEYLIESYPRTDGSYAYALHKETHEEVVGED